MAKIVSNLSLTSPEQSFGLDEVTVQNFTVQAALEGPQIIVNWNYDLPFDSGQVLEIKLVRRQFSFPATDSDGLVVFSEVSPTTTFYADRDVKEDCCFYYKMFHRTTLSDPLFISSEKTQGVAIPYITGEWGPRLYSLLDPLYRIFDRNRTTGRVFTVDSVIPSGNLDPVTGSVDPLKIGQELHIYEDGVTAKYFTQRLLSAVGLVLDRIRQRTKQIPDLLDVDSTCSDILPLIANLLGLRANLDIPIPRMRAEIKNAVSNYKIKGTLPGIESVIEQITGSDVILDEWGDNILVTNRLDRTTFDFTLGIKRGTANEPHDYTPSNQDNEYNVDKLAIYIDLGTSLGIEGAIISKLNRILPDHIPLDLDHVLIVTTGANEDPAYLQMDDLEAEATDTIFTLDEESESFDLSDEAVSDTITDIILFTNTTDHSSNSTNSLVPHLMP